MSNITVIGGGIVGCMTALTLAHRGHQVTIVERNQIAAQTSGESSWAGAGVLLPLLPWMYKDEVNILSMRGAALYPAICQQLLDETGVDPEYTQSGMLLLSGPSEKLDETPAEKQFAKVQAQQATAWCDANHQPLIEASPAYIARQGLTVESAGKEGLMPGLILTSVAQVRPPNLLQALKTSLLQNGVKLIEHTELVPLKLTKQINTWATTTGDVLTADQFVVTSGAWSFDLLKETAAELHIKPMRGQILLYKQPKQTLQHIVYSQGFYIVPRRDGYLLAGSTLEDVGFDYSTTEDVKHELQNKAEAIYPRLKNTSIIKHWSGLRPGTPDNIPTIAAHPSIKNLFLNTGHFRYGLTMAPASAERLANLIAG